MKDNLTIYYELLSRWNKSIKLVSRADSFDQFACEHVGDVLRLRRHTEGARTLLDLGTGAGIPGILIKLDSPEIDVVLLDSVRKKISFCAEAIRHLQLDGIRAVEGRAEDETIIQTLGHFDVIVSRGTWKLDSYIRMAVPYMKERGSRILSLKGPGWEQELSDAKAALEEHEVHFIRSDEYRLEDGRPRCIVVLGRG